MTGIEMLRDVCKALKGSPWFITEIATIGGEPAYEKLRKIADQIERETLPRPLFNDGEPVQFGDEFVTELGDVGEVEQIDLREGGWSVWSYSSHKASNTDGPLKRPEPTKVLDADGVEIKVGDKVWMVEDGDGPWTVEKIDGERVSCVSDVSKWHRYARCSVFTHKRPEPPDSWERVDADSKKFVCDYYGRKLMFDCREGKSDACPASGTDDECDMRMAQDLVRRCKKLAGVG